MVRNISIIVKLDINITNIRKCMRVLRNQCIVFIIFNIPIHYENKY